MTAMFDDQRRTPSWLSIGPDDGLRKRRSRSTDSMMSVSDEDDECLPGTSTPSGLSKGSFLKSWLPMPSPKKHQSNDSLCDSGFQDTSLVSEVRNECSEVPPLQKEPRQSSDLLAYALSLSVAFVIFGALGFGLMMMINKEAVEVDHKLNGKYKSMQYARERIQTGSNEEGGDLDNIIDVDELLDSSMLNMEYPDDPNFRANSHIPQYVIGEHDYENANTDHVNPDAKQVQDDLIDYPDDPQFRTSYV